ncbi:MAG: hypothetical protein N2447_06805 [Thermoanaerobaculum sp.]|nr:hypothetical protein [Thermoanaerobaculum sp.]
MGEPSAEVAAHVASCAPCAAHAALLAQLARLEPKPLTRWPGTTRLPHPPWIWRQPTTYTTLAAGLLFLGLGIGWWIAAGGVPAGAQLDVLARAWWEGSGMALGEVLQRASQVMALSWGRELLLAAGALLSLGFLLWRWVWRGVQP